MLTELADDIPLQPNAKVDSNVAPAENVLSIGNG